MRLTVETPCHDCRRKTVADLGRVIIANGDSQIRARCRRCGLLGMHSFPHSILRDAPLDALEVFDVYPQPRCARCGARGAEEHHWAPRHIFGNKAGTWPTDFLCRPCHLEWHQAVTPFMSEQSSRRAENSRPGMTERQAS